MLPKTVVRFLPAAPIKSNLACFPVADFLYGAKRNDFIIKQTGLLCPGCPLLAAQGIIILRLTGNAISFRHNFGGFDHLDIRRWRCLKHGL